MDRSATVLLVFLGALALVSQAVALPEGVALALELPPSEENPRNSEGDFATLKDGRVLFVYTHFYGGGGDHAAARLAARYSSDGGRTWTDRDAVVVENEGGMNVMSVSLLRLKNGKLALFYLRKNSTDDCRPMLRLSEDEGATWSEPHLCIESPVGYYVVNNDRVVQLDDGRLVIPAARHALKGEPFGPGHAMCFLSDDDGQTWHRSETVLEPRPGDGTGWQEPGVVALKDGRLMMFIRTRHGAQFVSYSEDRGVTWSAPEGSSMLSPVSPASIERIPETGDLLLVWNNHQDIAPELQGKRTPLCTAVSKDDGKTWTHVKTLHDDPEGWYCYTAVHFVDGAVLLGYCSSDSRYRHLARTEINRFDTEWLYE